MDKHFQEVVKWYKPIVKLTHRQDVMRMYRKALRTITSWSESRDVFNMQATKIRAEFTANKNVPVGSAALERIMRESKERLAANAHPDPYIQAYMPGGTLFMRNPTFPLGFLYPDGIPEGVSRRQVNIDFSNVPDGQQYADKVFVDSASKSYWMDK